MRRYGPRVLVGLLAVAFVGIIGAPVVNCEFAVLGSVTHDPADQDFDPAVWRQHSAGGTDQTRLTMANDLMRSKRFRGMTRQEGLDLLGPPTKERVYEGYLTRRPQMLFTLGAERGLFSIDSAWLVVELDPVSGTVQSAHEETD